MVGCTPDLVAVDKVAGVPVHAVGQYRKNTVMGILQVKRRLLLTLPRILTLPVLHVTLCSYSLSMKLACACKSCIHSVCRHLGSPSLCLCPPQPANEFCTYHVM